MPFFRDNEISEEETQLNQTLVTNLRVDGATEVRFTCLLLFLLLLFRPSVFVLLSYLYQSEQIINHFCIRAEEEGSGGACSILGREIRHEDGKSDLLLEEVVDEET